MSQTASVHSRSHCYDPSERSGPARPYSLPPSRIKPAPVATDRSAMRFQLTPRTEMKPREERSHRTDSGTPTDALCRSDHAFPSRSSVTVSLPHRPRDARNLPQGSPKRTVIHPSEPPVRIRPFTGSDKFNGPSPASACLGPAPPPPHRSIPP
jgi:hypothetical protein